MRLPRHIGIIPDEKPKVGFGPGDREAGWIQTWHFTGNDAIPYVPPTRHRGNVFLWIYRGRHQAAPAPSARHLQKHAWRLWRNCQRRMPACLYWAIPGPPCFLRNFFPDTRRHDFGAGGMKINFLVNYSSEWDMGFKTGKVRSLILLRPP